MNEPHEILHLTIDGREIQCTKNHQIGIVDSNGDTHWKCAESLTEKEE